MSLPINVQDILKSGKYFSIERDTDGREECYNVVFRPTGRVIATYYLWLFPKERRQEVRQQVVALTNLLNSGGKFHTEALEEANVMVTSFINSRSYK